MHKIQFLFASLFLYNFTINHLPVKAQIIPDNTLGTDSSKITPNVSIKNGTADRIDGGITRESNLFHSFSEFNIKDGQRVYFSNPSGVLNILTRVTGKNSSSIFGTLGVDGNANLFLMNPNGILFGKNASLDVQGSFVATTANSLQFGNQGVFSATNPQAPALLTINPNALVFSQQQSSAVISNQSQAPAGTDPAGFDALGLRVPDGKSLLLVGGNVSMDGGSLNAFGGRVELGGLTEPGNVDLLFNGDNLSLKFPENISRADVSLNNQAFVYVEGAGGGDIITNVRNLEILQGSILNAGIGAGLGTPDTVAGDITLNATGGIKVADSGSSISNLVRENSKGNGGNIFINSGLFSLRDGAQLQASTFGQGNAGNITVSAKDTVFLAGNAYIFSTVEAGGVGQGGNIDINAGTLSLTNGALLLTITSRASATQPAGRGDAGNVNLKVTGEVDIAGMKNGLISGIFSYVGTGTVGNGGSINIDAGSFKLQDGVRLQASTFGQGNAGNVTVSAKNTAFLAGALILSTVETGGVGQGGNIDINAGTLSLTNGSQLLTITRGASATQPAARGDAGNVNLKVTGAVDITGVKNGLSSSVLSYVGTGTVGNGGNINIDAGSLNLQDGTQIAASTFGQGNAGNVTVSAKDAVFLTGNPSILSTVEAGGVGQGGNIDINAGTLSLTNGSQLLTITRGASATQPAGRGDAGNVNLKVTGAVNIAGVKNGLSSGILSYVSTGTVGNGGNINIDAGSLNLQDGTRLQASTFGEGNAGNVTVSAKDNVSLTGNAGILSAVEAGGVGQGGNIDINAETLSLTDGAQINASVGFGGVGTAGDINIKTQALSLTNGSQIDSILFRSSQGKPAARGRSGNIRIDATDTVTISGISNLGFSSALFTITEKGTSGEAGDITVNTGNFTVSDGAIVSATTSNSDNGGNITINTKNFTAINGGQLATNTRDSGNAGSIKLNATDKVTITGSDPNFSDRVTKVTQRLQQPGETDQIRDVIFNQGAESGLFVSSTGSGVTGDIEVNSPKITLDNQGKLNAESSSGNGGNINVNSDVLLLRRGSQISSTAGTAQSGGDGGNINLNTKFIVAVPKENSDILANAFTGKGGNVNIQTQGIFGIEPRPKPTDKSDITASSELGVQGQVSIQKPDVDPSRGLIQLPGGFKDKSDQIDQLCGRGKKPLGRFVVVGKNGSIPSNPVVNPMQGGIDFTPLASLDESNSTNRVNQIPDSLTVQNPPPNRIVEAQAIVRGADGTLYLVAEAPNAIPNSRSAVPACANVRR
jgi:filamentous hemagglutinin family protein